MKKDCTECEGTGTIIINAGCCGACEVCGSREEQEVPCPHCTPPKEEDSEPIEPDTNDPSQFPAEGSDIQ